jgi:hypothetical protein
MGHPFWSGVNQLYERLLAVAVVVDVAGAFQRNGVRRPGVALLGLGLTNCRLRDLAGVGGGTAAHWIDHRHYHRHLRRRTLANRGRAGATLDGATLKRVNWLDTTRSLLAIAVVVDLSRAFQRDLVVGEGAALWHRRSLGSRIGFRFRRRLSDLVNIGRMYAADWRDHIWSPKE